jgi:GlpG protein
MRQIGSIPDEARATRFGDHLLTLGIRNSVEENGGGAWAVWVENDDHLERSRGELEAFLLSPDDPKYSAAARNAVAVRAAEKKKHEKLRKRFVDVRTSWATGGRTKCPATIVLIVLSVAATFLTRFGEQPLTAWILFSDTAAQAGFDRILQGQVWRLISPIFLHLSPMHLLFNMLMLANMGALLETKKGTRFYIGFVLVSAVVSCVGQVVWSQAMSGNPYFGGMSGVLYAVFGYIWMKERYEPHLELQVGQTTILILMIWLVVCMLGMMGNVANAAHVAGLLAGALWGYSPTGWRKVKREFRR